MQEIVFTLGMLLTFLPLGFFWSCYPCCDVECIIWDDTFDTDLTATDYDIRAGSFTVASGNLSTTSTDALIIADTGFDDASGVVRTQISFGVLAIGDKLRLIGAYKDDGNYLAGEVVKTNTAVGTLRLIGVVTGTPTTLIEEAGFDIDPNNPDYCLSWDGTFATLANGVDHVRAEFTPHADGKQAGMGSGDTVTGTVRFTRFILSKSPIEAESCTDCVICTPCSDLEPEDVTVEISGVANDSCSTCGGYNTTWVLDPVDGQSCEYRIIAAVCFGFFMTYSLRRGVGNVASHRLQSAHFTSGFVTIASAPIVCESRSMSINTFTDAGGTCDVTNMVADITLNP
jgi:hypothetical protein